MRGTFETFIRVDFGGDANGNSLQGSGASEKYEWHVRHRRENQAGQWVRTTGDQQETDVNDIGPPRIDPGDNP